MLANGSDAAEFASDSASVSAPVTIKRLGQSLINLSIGVGFLIFPAAVTLGLASFPSLRPVISVSFVLAISAAAWWRGTWAGLAAACGSVPVLTLAASRGKLFLPAKIDPVGLIILCLIAVLVSWVAATRKRMEEVLRSANTQLESKVAERTAELQEANAAIQHEFAQVESLYAELPVGVCFLDKNLRYVRINEKLADINGFPATAHSGRELREMIPAGLAEVLEPLFRRVFMAEEPLVNFEIADPHADPAEGGRTWLISSSPVKAAAGIVLGLQVIVQDITDRKRAEYALRQAHTEVKRREEQFRTLANAIPQLAWMTDSGGSALWCNERWIRYTGIAVEQMQDSGWTAAHDPDYVPAVAEKWKSSLATGDPFEMEFPIRAADGDFRWFLTRVLPMAGDSGQPVRWFGTATDIDELKRSREALLESEARFRAMADAAPVMIWISDRDKVFTWFNKPWLDFTGNSMSQELAQGWLQGIHPDDRARCLEIYSTSFDDRKPYALEYRRRRGDGQWRWVFAHGVPRSSSNGEFAGFIGSCIDIHNRKEMEEDLRRANNDLQQFAFSASHDLQEPIRTVAIYSQLVARRYGPKLDENAQTFLEYLITAAKRMEKLVHDLLFYTKTGHIEVPPATATDANECLREALVILAASIREAGAQVTSDPLPCVKMHEVHLQQLFQNLVGNGIKYRGEREPLVHVSARQQDACWLFSVQDNGIGIDPAYKERIFGIFKRLHTSDKYSGTGIGLAICQRIVERYRGRIWVESELGKGATFFFTIPI